MSQADVGRELGISFQQVQKYEKGTNRISAGRLFEVAQLFDVQVSYFFEGLFSPEESAGGKTVQLSVASVEFAQAFLRVKDGQVRKRILDLLKLLGVLEVQNELLRRLDRPGVRE